MHGDDDQIVPIADSALLSAKLLKNGTLKVYEKFPHGMCTTHADVGEPGPARLHRPLAHAARPEQPRIAAIAQRSAMPAPKRRSP